MYLIISSPINQALTFQGRTVHPPLFMADIIVILTNLDEQKESSKIFWPCRACVSMNGKERKISNQFTDDGKGLVSMISFTEFRPGEPLVAIDDDGSSTCVLSMAEYSSLSNTTNQHILSHRPLSECNVWALATHAPTVTLGVNVPPNVRHHFRNSCYKPT